MFSLCTLASGSSGNSSVICSGTTSLLIDAGISARRITTGLSMLAIAPTSLDGICITHSHTDHISGLRVLLKRTPACIYTTEATATALVHQLPECAPRIRIIRTQEPFAIGTLTVTAFATPHDASGSVGFTMTDGVRKCAFVTDLGYVTEEVRQSILGAHLALVEANHDVDWVRTGPYPPALQARILGNKGHLSNESCAQLCCELAATGTQRLILGHLSQENNSPEHALSVVTSTLRRNGYCSIPVTVASRSEYGMPYEV